MTTPRQQLRDYGKELAKVNQALLTQICEALDMKKTEEPQKPNGNGEHKNECDKP